MQPATYYVNVHTTVFPAGAVRGQLTSDRVPGARRATTGPRRTSPPRGTLSGSCHSGVPSPDLTVRLRNGREPRWKQLANGDVEIDPRCGQEALIAPAGSRPDLTIAPVPVAIPAHRGGLP